MAIISRNNVSKKQRYWRTLLRYALTYIIITFGALVFLNLYCSKTCQRLFYQNKESAMLEKTHLAANALGKLESMTVSDVAYIVERMPGLTSTLFIVTDEQGRVLYCSDGTFLIDQTTPHPHIPKAIGGYDVFEWNYHNGVMRSEAAIPVVSNGVTVGCVYSMERDTEQGTLLRSLQRTILSITVVLELAVILFSLIFAQTFSGRMRKIMTSMKILQEGDYSHKLVMGGNDELTVLADEFNDLTERLQTSENKRRQFVSDASHELKTPLASIKLLSDSILQNEMDRETTQEFVRDIGDEAERLIRMSDKLLSLTKSEPTESDQHEIIYMSPTIERVVSMLSILARSSQIQIETHLEDDVPILIREDDLYQITFNLVENGIKYNIPGGKLTIELCRTEDQGILIVRDTGTGIPEDSLSHIFERFYRVDKARSRASGGSGLGLAIVKNMVERNQGTIHVESTFGLGTTFTVVFPAFDIEEGEDV